MRICRCDTPIKGGEPAELGHLAKILLSTGVGRLHFAEASAALLAIGVDITVLTGWVPTQDAEAIAKLLGRLVGRRDLFQRLRVRTDAGVPMERIRQLVLAEGLAQGAYKLGSMRLLPQSATQALAWKFFGAASRTYLTGHHILHVRSGAGQGGFIRAARRKGLKIVVDHSIAHPLHTARVVTPVSREHGEPFSMGPDSPFWRLVLQDCGMADCLLVNSEFVRETFVQAGYPQERIEVAYLGVRDDFIGLKRSWSISGTVKLLFTGTFCGRKGAHTVLEAMSLLNDSRINFELVVAGTVEVSGRDLDALQRDNRIRLTGRVPQDELKSLLRDSDIYVFPTLSEGCAKSAMEALAAGLPVITTRASGLPVVDGLSASLVPLNDARSVANAICRLSSDHEQRMRLGVEGTRLVTTDFRWCSYAKKVNGIYRDLLSLK